MADLFLLILSRSLAVIPLIGVVLLLRLALRSAPKWTLCLLWALVGLRLVCPSFPESPFSIAPDSAGSQLMIQWADGYAGLIPTDQGAAVSETTVRLDGSTLHAQQSTANQATGGSAFSFSTSAPMVWAASLEPSQMGSLLGLR